MAKDGKVVSSLVTVGVVTSIADFFDVLFSDLIGASDGEFFGNFIGGAEEEKIDVGASAMGEGLGETVEV